MRKLLLLLLIAVVGAGIAFGANAAFFSTASSDRPPIEPRGLIDDIAAQPDEPSPAPSASPSPTPPASGEGTTAVTSSTGGGTGAPAPAADDGNGPQDPRTPSGAQPGPQATSVVIQGVWDEQDNPEDPCDLEESEKEQRECEREAEQEEDEAEEEADADNDNNNGND